MGCDFKLAIALGGILCISSCGDDSGTKQPVQSQQSGAVATEPAVAEQPEVTTEVTTGFSYECPDDTLTIVDICVGMPPDQVKAMLLKRDPEVQISERLASFSYSDGAEQLRTEPYLERVRAETASDEYYEFHFTAPPGEGKLVYMSRTLGSEANLPPIDRFMAALEDNYGEPSFRHRGQAGSLVGTLRWDFPEGRVSCSEKPQNDSGLVLEMTGRVSFSQLDHQIQKVRERGVADPADCAAWLQVYIQTFNETDPVRSVDMKLTDFALGVAEARETIAWLDQKEAEARAARLENAQVPDL